MPDGKAAATAIREAREQINAVMENLARRLPDNFRVSGCDIEAEPQEAVGGRMVWEVSARIIIKPPTK
jgi:hypothetical protein